MRNGPTGALVAQYVRGSRCGLGAVGGFLLAKRLADRESTQSTPLSTQTVEQIVLSYQLVDVRADTFERQNTR